MRGLIDRALAWVADHAWKGYGTAVDISSYTSSNKYTVPSDGIIVVACTYRSNNYIQVFVDGNIMAQPSTSANANSGGNVVVPIPVFKGQEVYVTRSSNYSNATFYPYENYGGGTA